MTTGLAALAVAMAGVAITFYVRHDLALSHYDAKAHLVVARRVIDNLTPGWQQFGAVWLPLPHILNFLPVQIDLLYRTGASAIALSALAYVIAIVCLARFALRVTGSAAAAACAAGVFGLDPNVLYLAATPMTELLLYGLLAWSLERWAAWLERPLAETSWQPGAVTALACLTRYEAWPVTAALVAGGAIVLVREGLPVARALRLASRPAWWPAAAIVLFLINSRITTGAWFVSGGFFVPENEALGQPVSALWQVGWGLVQLRGPWLPPVGVLGGAVAVWWLIRGTRPWHRSALALALPATAALPFYAFLQGHPFRIRYMVALTVALAALSALLVAALPRRRLRGLAVLAVLALAIAGAPPLGASTAMVREARWDRPRMQARTRVTACLAPRFSRPEHKILASMGSLAPYMHELARDGFRLDDFIHEGTGLLWPAALEQPARHVHWVLIEEKAEGGDELAGRLRAAPDWLAAFERRCEGGGVALYERRPRRDIDLPSSGPMPSAGGRALRTGTGP